MRGGRRVATQQLQAALVELLVVPGDSDMKKLQALHGPMLGADYGFGALTGLAAYR